METLPLKSLVIISTMNEGLSTTVTLLAITSTFKVAGVTAKLV